MDGVVTVCDAALGPATLDAGFESVQQVAMADVLVLAGTDLVTPSEAERFRAWLTALAPGTRIVTANYSDAFKRDAVQRIRVLGFRP